MLALRGWEAQIHTLGTDTQTYRTDRHTYGTDRQTHIWDRHTDRHIYGTDRQTPKTVFMLKKFLFVVGSAPE